MCNRPSFQFTLEFVSNSEARSVPCSDWANSHRRGGSTQLLKGLHIQVALKIVKEWHYIESELQARQSLERQYVLEALR